jgi:Ice-binding-like
MVGCPAAVISWVLGGLALVVGFRLRIPLVRELRERLLEGPWASVKALGTRSRGVLVTPFLGAWRGHSTRPRPHFYTFSGRPGLRRLVTAVLALIFGMGSLFSPLSASAATLPNLGTAANFAVLAATTVTNTGPTVITGDLGLSPGSSVTGFPPGTVVGNQHVADPAAVQAQNDLVTGYTDAATAPPDADLTGQNLGGMNLTPGVYTFSSSALLSGPSPLTLSGNGVFIFKIGSTLTTASNAVVLLTNGAQACAVFWQVGSSATLGTATTFEGTVMALTSITMTTGAKITSGRALARNGAVTLDTNQITSPTGPCTVPPAPTPPVGPTPTASTSVGPPNTGSPPQGPDFPWWPTIGALLLGLRIRTYHRDS